MASQITIQTSQNVDLQYQIAPLGERIIAYIIDGLIRVALLIALLVVIGMITPNFIEDGLNVLAVFVIVIVALPFVGYHLFFEIFNNGQTPGKKIFDLRVISIKGDMVSIAAYFLRWLFRIVDFHIFSGLVAVIAIASSDKGQRIGDMVAGTAVIKESRRVNFRQLAYEEVKPEYMTTYPEAATLQPSHIELIKEALSDMTLVNAEEHIRLLADKTATIMGVVFNEHPRRFLRTVVNDYSASARL